MAKLLPIKTPVEVEKKTAEVVSIVESTTDADADADTSTSTSAYDDLVQSFDEHLYEEMWDCDLDLELNQNDVGELNFYYGYIRALRDVAKSVFGYTDSTLNQLSPNYTALAVASNSKDDD